MSFRILTTWGALALATWLIVPPALADDMGRGGPPPGDGPPMQDGGWRAQERDDGGRPPGPPGAERMREGMPAFIARRLNLSDAQQQAIREVMARNRPAMQRAFEAERQAREALDQVGADDPRLAALASDAGRATAGMLVLRKRAEADVEGLLTPAQRAQLAAVKAQRREHFAGDPRDGRGAPGRPFRAD